MMGSCLALSQSPMWLVSGNQAAKAWDTKPQNFKSSSIGVRVLAFRAIFGVIRIDTSKKGQIDI